MKITITGEHKGVTKLMAVWEYTKEVIPGEPIDVEEKIMDELRKQIRNYIQTVVKNESKPNPRN